MHSRAKKTNKMHARTASRIGNNQKCPCGSKKKYKKCCKKNVILNKKTKKVQLGRRVQWDEN